MNPEPLETETAWDEAQIDLEEGVIPVIVPERVGALWYGGWQPEGRSLAASQSEDSDVRAGLAIALCCGFRRKHKVPDDLVLY